MKSNIPNFFYCANCTKKVPIRAMGTKNRNHCPFCLYSIHVDVTIGDRKSTCHGLMEPIGKCYKLDGEEMLLHKCIKCGFVRKNRVAGDDSFGAVAKLPVVSQSDLC